VVSGPQEMLEAYFLLPCSPLLHRLMVKARQMWGICAVSQPGGTRESLIAELREIERKDADFYRQQRSGSGDVNTYTLRQQRRREILLEIADLRRYSRLSLSIDVTLFSTLQGRILGRISDMSAFGFAAASPLELSVGEIVRAEIHLPFGTKVIQAVVRNRNGAHHNFEFIGIDLLDEMRNWMQ
jgi:hypothetical protein